MWAGFYVGVVALNDSGLKGGWGNRPDRQIPAGGADPGPAPWLFLPQRYRQVRLPLTWFIFEPV